MNPDALACLHASEALLRQAALRAADSGGRAHEEPEHPYRQPYQRDRDRIVHCAAFRRLDYKTQVFVPHEQDHFRTRLTHTLEVAQVARTLARALRLNEDVAEAVALAHDLGHAPFGHAGEQALDELMAGHGGFEHNRQSLRVVDVLEHPYSRFRGLNLTRVVRCCLAKHTTRYDSPDDAEFADIPFGPLEGQLVDMADEIAYTAADTYDALAAGWIDAGQLGELELWRQAWAAAEAAEPSARDVHKRIRACRNVLAVMADDAIDETARRLDRMHAATPADVMNAARRCAAFSETVGGAVGQLQDFLMRAVYMHPRSREHHDRARRIISGLFGAYLGEPARLPDRYHARVDEQGPHRVICDYVAGMTDRFADEQHRKVVAG